MNKKNRVNSDSYHHGDLEAELIHHALEGILEKGVNGLSLREVARRAGVSHGAPAHHFGDKKGLMTAIATEGFRRMTADMKAALDSIDDHGERFREAGKTYVRFAANNKAYFEVMWRPELHHSDNQELLMAALGSREILVEQTTGVNNEGVTEVDPEALALRGWSLAHGLAQLWLTGNINAQFKEEDLEKAIADVFDGESFIS